MRIVLEGAFTKPEVARLISLVQTMDKENPRTFSIVLEEYDWTMEEYLEFCDIMGLVHKAVLPADQEGDIHFENGSIIRLIPIREPRKRKRRVNL